jgi:hypothetical protein
MSAECDGGTFTQFHFVLEEIMKNFLIKPTLTGRMCTIFIGNIGGLTEYALIKLFQPFGTIKSIDYLWHKYVDRIFCTKIIIIICKEKDQWLGNRAVIASFNSKTR